MKFAITALETLSILLLREVQVCHTSILTTMHNNIFVLTLHSQFIFAKTDLIWDF